jgi:hypothetical protein
VELSVPALSVASPSVTLIPNEFFQGSIRVFLGLPQFGERLHALKEKFSNSSQLSLCFLFGPIHTGIRSVHTRIRSVRASIRSVGAGFCSRLTFQDELHRVLDVHGVKNTIAILPL